MKKVLSSLLLIFTLTAGSKAPALSKDVLNIGISAEFENLNPAIGTQAATMYMLYFAWRPLVYLGLDGKYKPMMIKQLPTIENKLAKKKGDGLDVTIEFLDNAQWGDGTPMTCKDLEFSRKVYLNPNVSIANREPIENISSITWDEKKPKKCVVSFKVAKFDFFLNFPDPLPSHLEEPIFEKFKGTPEGYDRNSLYTKNPTNPGLYSGPYVISEVKLGSHVTFIANPKYLGKKPYFQKVNFKLIPNNATLVANLRSGNIDMISPAAGLSPDQATAFERNVKTESMPYSVIFVDGYVYAHIDLNLDTPALSDLKVRKALSHAFNKKEIIKSLLEDKGKEASHFINPQDAWYTDKAPRYAYDKKEANRLLDEAGWKMGPNGLRQKDGKPLSLTVKTSAGAKINDMILTYLQGQFKAVGVQLSTKMEPARVFFSTTTNHRDFDLALYSWGSKPESSPRSTLHSASVPTAQNSWAGQNYPGWKNPEVDKLIDDLEKELLVKKRVEIGKKIAVKYAEEIPVLPLYFRQVNSVIPKAMKNYKLSGHQYYESLYAEDWSL